MFFKDIKDTENSFTYRRFIDTEIKVLDLIKNEEFEKAFKIIESEIDSLYDENISVDLIKTRLAVLKNFILDILSLISDSFSYTMTEEINIEKMMFCSSIPDLKNELSRIFIQVSEWSSSKSVKKNISDAALEFIDNNYADRNISAQTIADAVEISVPHLSMSFKKHKGIGVLDYIHKLRIDKAKNLLVDNSERIKSIADKVGYYSDIAFIRAFKRYEGITPGQYRNNHLNNNKEADN